MSVSVNQVGRVAPSTATNAAEQVEASRQRLELHARDVLARGGAALDLSSFHPSISNEEQASIRELFSRFPEAQRDDLRRASLQLGNALMTPGAVTSMGTMSAGLRDASTTTLTTYLAGAGADALHTVNQDFLYLALAGMNGQLTSFATDVDANTQLGKELRTTITEIQDILTHWPEGAETQEFTWQEVTYDDNGQAAVTTHTKELTKEEFGALRDKLEQQLANCQDIGELKKFDLQRLYQDYTQAVQTLANIQKQVHEDAKAILNNLRA